MQSMELFGKALKSYFIGDLTSHITIHNIGGRSDVMPASVFYRKADSMEIDKIALQLCKGRILDIGAGTGDHSLYLQNQGYKVTALDISNDSCEIIKTRGIREVICCDIFSLKSEVKYDTLLLLGRSIGAVGDIDGLKKFLQISKKLLSENGQIIFNSINEPSKTQWRSRQMCFEYNGQTGEPIDWLDIGESSFSLLANDHQYALEVIHREKDNNYLAVLRNK